MYLSHQLSMQNNQWMCEQSIPLEGDSVGWFKE